MPRIGSVALTPLLAVAMILSGVLATQPPSPASSLPDEANPLAGEVKQVLADGARELYVDKVTASEIPDTADQRVTVNLICKNLLEEPNSCLDIFFFSLVDSSGEEYRPKLTESRVTAAKIPTHDAMQGSLVFVMSIAVNATQLIYDEPESPQFLVDLTATKSPQDEPPAGEWRPEKLRGVTLSDSRMELKIFDETLTKDRYVLDLSIRNTGHADVDYNALYAFLKSGDGFVFGADLYGDVEPKIESGTVVPGQHVRGKIAFDTENEVGPFMLLYDDINRSYFATGKFLPIEESGVRGELVGNDGGDKVRIEKHNAYSDPAGRDYRIIGEVSNGSEDFVGDIRVSAVVRDESKNVLAERNQTLTNPQSTMSSLLAPGAKIPFIVKFSISSAQTAKIRTYELSTLYSVVAADAKKTVALNVTSAELIQLSKPTPISKYVVWQIKGKLVNNGDARSTNTNVVASLYDAEGSLVGSGGFSSLDAQPRDLNPGQEKSFSIEVSLPVESEPTSFYLYAESDQSVMMILPETVVEPAETPEEAPIPSQNLTLVKITSKQRGDLLELAVRNLPDSTGKVYGLQFSTGEASIHALTLKLRWGSEDAGNEVLLSTPNNPLWPGQKTKFRFSVDSEVQAASWKVLDLDGTVLVEGEVKPLQVRTLALPTG